MPDLVDQYMQKRRGGGAGGDIVDRYMQQRRPAPGGAAALAGSIGSPAGGPQVFADDPDALWNRSKQAVAQGKQINPDIYAPENQSANIELRKRVIRANPQATAEEQVAVFEQLAKHAGYSVGPIESADEVQWNPVQPRTPPEPIERAMRLRDIPPTRWETDLIQFYADEKNRAQLPKEWRGDFDRIRQEMMDSGGGALSIVEAPVRGAVRGGQGLASSGLAAAGKMTEMLGTTNPSSFQGMFVAPVPPVIARVAQAANLVGADTAEGFYDAAEYIGKIEPQVRNRKLRQHPRMFDPNISLVDPERWANVIGEAGGTMAISALGAPLGPAGIFIMAAGQEGGGKYIELVNEQVANGVPLGVARHDASVGAAIHAVGVGALESIGLGKVIKAFGGQRGFKKILEAAATEGGTEVAQEFLGDVVRIGTIDSDEASWEAFREDFLEGKWKQYVLAGGAGVFLGGGVSGVGQIGRSRDEGGTATIHEETPTTAESSPSAPPPPPWWRSPRQPDSAGPAPGAGSESSSDSRAVGGRGPRGRHPASVHQSVEAAQSRPAKSLAGPALGVSRGAGSSVTPEVSRPESSRQPSVASSPTAGVSVPQDQGQDVRQFTGSVPPASAAGSASPQSTGIFSDLPSPPTVPAEEDLASLPYKELRERAKAAGVLANQSKVKLVEELARLRTVNAEEGQGRSAQSPQPPERPSGDFNLDLEMAERGFGKAKRASTRKKLRDVAHFTPDQKREWLDKLAGYKGVPGGMQPKRGTRIETENDRWAGAQVDAAIAELERRGYKPEYTSDSGSVYFNIPGVGRIRISDHQVPLTGERSHAAMERGTESPWDDEIIFTGRRAKSEEEAIGRAIARVEELIKKPSDSSESPGRVVNPADHAAGGVPRGALPANLDAEASPLVTESEQSATATIRQRIVARDDTARAVAGQATAAPPAAEEAVPAEPAESKLDAIEQAARERLKKRTALPRRKGKGNRPGATPLYSDIADLSIIVAMRAAKAGVRGFKAVRSIAEQVVNETAPKFRKSIGRITTQANRMLLRSRNDAGDFDSEKFERELTDVMKKAEATDRRRFGKTIKQQIREETGARRNEPLTVQESEALKGRIKGEILAGRIGYKASTETTRLLSAVKKVNPKKLRQDFLETVEGLPDEFLSDKSPSARIKDVAAFMDRYPGQALTADMRELVAKLDSAKLRNLTPEEADALRRMVRTFLSLHRQHGKLLADAKQKRFQEAIDEAKSDLQKAKQLDTSKRTPKHRGTLRNTMMDWQAMPDVRAIALGGTGTISHRVFYDNLRRHQVKALELERSVRDDIDAELDKQGIKESDVWRLRSKGERIKLGTKVYEMTRAEMMAFYALWNRVEARGKIVRNGFKARRFKGLLKEETTVKGDEAQMHDWAQEIIGKLTPGEKAVVDTAVRAVKEKITPNANQSARRLMGTSIFTEEDYTLPIRTERTDTQRHIEPDLKNFEQKWIENAGFTKETIQHKHPIMVDDFFSEMYGHIQQMATFAELGAPIRDALKFLGHPEYGSMIRERFGEAFEQRTVKMLARLSGMDQQPRTNLEKPAALITRYLAVGKLGFRATTYLANRLGGLSLGSAYLKPAELAALSAYSTRALAGLDIGGFTRQEKAVLAKLEANGYLGHRWNVDSYRLGVPGFNDADSRIVQSEMHERWRQFQNFATSHMRYAERRNAVAFFRAMTAAGESEANAIERVELITRFTQNPVTPMEESEFVENAKRNPFAALVWMFTSQINATRNMAQRAYVEAKQEKSAAAYARLGVSATAIVVNIAVMIAVRELWRRTKEGFKEPDKGKARETADHLTAAAAEVADLVFPGVGDAINLTARKIRKKPTYNRTMVGELIEAFTSLSADLVRIMDSGEKEQLRENAKGRIDDHLADILEGLGVPMFPKEVIEAVIETTAEEKPTERPKRPTRPKRPKRPRR